LTDRRLFEDLGGLRGQFLQGDFEDSDYCLRLRTAGRDVWYAADVELLHLEGMSYPNELRAAVGRYNKWLHTQLWDGVISDIMADPSVRPARVAAELAGPATSDESAGSVGVRQ
jgi:O-antigen biosynthesis protein